MFYASQQMGISFAHARDARDESNILRSAPFAIERAAAGF